MRLKSFSTGSIVSQSLIGGGHERLGFGAEAGSPLKSFGAYRFVVEVFEAGIVPGSSIVFSAELLLVGDDITEDTELVWMAISNDTSQGLYSCKEFKMVCGGRAYISKYRSQINSEKKKLFQLRRF